MMSAQGFQAFPGTTTTVRPITEAEARAVKGVLRPMRANAIGIAILSMVMAIMINFVTDPVALLLPIVFSFMALGYAVQTRRTAGNVSKALAGGTVTDVRAVPTQAGPGKMWQFGGYVAPRSSELKHRISEGAPAYFTVLPAVRQLLAVNGAPLRKPLTITVPPGMTTPQVAAMPMPAMQPMPASGNEDLPPPPDDWTGQRFCTMCGHKFPANARFCEKCGAPAGK